MRFNLKLSQQGLILVGVPIGFMLVFLISLLVLLMRVEQEAKETDRSKTIIAKANSLVKQYYDAASLLMIYKYTKTDKIKNQFEEQLTSTLASFTEIHSLILNDPAELELLEQLKMIADKGMSLMRRYENHLAGGEKLNLLEVSALYRKFDSTGALFTAKLQELVSHETARHRINSEEEVRSRLLVKVVILTGVLIAIATGALLTLRFTTFTTNRLALLMENTVRLSNKEPLLPILEGKDEIAELDKFFHRMAEILDEAARKEKEVERLKQEFVAMVSHELRTPLTSLQATLTLLMSGTYGQLTDTGEKRVQAAESGITRLIVLISDLLDIEKMEAGKLSMSFCEVDVGEIVERAQDSARGFAEQQGVTLKSERSSAKVFADPDRMVQVLVNLLSNAIKYSDDGGSVEVAIAESADHVEVTVSDHGAGVPAGFEQTIFEKYEQAHSPDGKRRKGTGLGLPICKAIVEQHNGEIGVKASEGGGSTFWFKLPRVSTSEIGLGKQV
jgi:signal transduction histidine kinase